MTDTPDWRKAAPYMAEIVDTSRWIRRITGSNEYVDSARKYIDTVVLLYDEPTRMAARAELDVPY